MRNYSIYTLKTKLEFTNLYQYLSEKDYKQLEQQILCHSYHTPICTWNGIVINGIEAYELFRKHSIPFRIKRLHFSSKEDVISWICTDQLKRCLLYTSLSLNSRTLFTRSNIIGHFFNNPGSAPTSQIQYLGFRSIKSFPII